MKASTPRRAAFAALLLAPVLAACGFNAQTDKVYQAATGVNDRSGQVDVLNALIVSGTDGSGTFVTSLVNKDQSTKDQLTGITGDGVTVETGGSISVPADSLVNLADSGQVSVDGEAVQAGKFVTLTLAFASGQSTTVTVPVVSDDGDYADVPLPSESKSPSGKPSGKPSGNATQGPGAESTQTPSEPSQEPTGSAG